MIGRTFDRQQPGEVIQPRVINRPLDTIERALRLRVAAPLRQVNISGSPLLSTAIADRVKARLVASLGGGKYSWQGVYGTTGGAWHDMGSNVSDRSALDPAWEFNLNAALKAGTIVDLERDDATNEWRFLYDNCTSPTPPPPPPQQIPPPGVAPASLATPGQVFAQCPFVSLPPYLNNPTPP